MQKKVLKASSKIVLAVDRDRVCDFAPGIFPWYRRGETRLQSHSGEERRSTAHGDHRIEFGRHRRPCAGRGSVGGCQQGHDHVG